MREELHQIEKIEKYLDGEMDDSEKQDFENEMSEKQELQKEVDFFKNFREGIARQAIKLDIKKAQYQYIKKARKWGNIKKFLFGGGGFLLLTIIVLLVVLPDEGEPENEHNIFSELFTTENYEIKKAFPDDPFKDYLPESEFFTIDNTGDTSITSADGIKLYLPKGSLRMPDGSIPTENITIEIADANNADESILGNLLGDDDNLNLENMAFVNAKAGNVQLEPDKESPPYMEFPRPFTEPNKRIFSGKRDEKGNTKWSEPKLPDNFLTPVKFKYLDYYPDSFEHKVAENLPFRGHQTADRQLLDSLFYGILLIKNNETSDCPSENCGICPQYIKAFANKKYERSLLATREFMERLKIIYKTCDKELLHIYLNNSQKQLWEIDEMAYQYLSSKGKVQDNLTSETENKPNTEILTADGEKLDLDAKSLDYQKINYAQIFKDFAAQKLTNVPNAHIYAALIAKEYEKDLKKVLSEQKIIEKTYKEEIKANIKAEQAQQKRIENYKILVEKRVKTRMKAYGFKVTSLGWKAIAEIEKVPAVVPEPLIIGFQDFEKYDHYHCYFAVTELDVIAKVNRFGEGQFIMNEHRIINIPRFNTNKITLVAVAYKGKEIYLSQMPYATEQSGTINMNPVLTATEDAKTLLNALGGKSKTHSIWYDLEQQKAFYAEFLRKQKIAKEDAFRHTLHNIIYPCCQLSLARPNSGYEPGIEFEEPDYDKTNWEYREGIEVIHANGKREYIFKHNDPVRYKKYLKIGGGKSTVTLEK